MASSPGTLSQHKLGKRPAGWTSYRNHYVVLSFTVDGENDTALSISYMEGFTPPGDGNGIKSFVDFASLKLTPSQPILDLDVYNDCFLEVWLDPNKNWRWSRELDAITTKKPYEQLYFELKYRDGDDWYDRADFPADKVPMVVRFGAKHNKPPTYPEDKHGFSLNLELVDSEGEGLPITIDPDIRNPTQA